MAKMSGAQALAEGLKKMECKRVYGIIGTSIVALIDGLQQARNDIRYISCRHEQVAASMADAEGRVTGRPGVCLVHSGGGALNALISLTNAAKDCSPVICITGAVKRKLVGTDGMLELNHLAVFRPICKDVFRAETADQIPSILSQAFRAAMQGCKGPVLVEIPEDINLDVVEIDESHYDFSLPETPLASEEDVDAIVSALLDAQRPVILGGAGIAYAGGADLFRKFVETLGVPVITTGNGRGVIPETHPLCLGRCGFGGGNIVADSALRDADVVAAVGCTVSDMSTYEYSWPVNGEVHMVNLDRNNDRIRVGYNVCAYGDARDFLDRALKKIEGKGPLDLADWMAQFEKPKALWTNMVNIGRNAAKSPVSPGKVCDRLNGMIPDDAIITVGAGMHLLYPMNYIPSRMPLTFLTACNFGAMGFGFAAALGAKLAFPDRTVVNIIGDGDFMMTCQDLETAVRENIPIKVLILNDNAYRVLVLRQKLQFEGRIYGSQHGNPDFKALADSFGAAGLRLDKDEDIDATLEKFLAETRPVVLDTIIDPEDMPATNLQAVMAMGQDR